MRTPTLPVVVALLAQGFWASGRFASAAAGSDPIASSATVRSAVEHMLATQAAAWNRGDLEAFCAVYAGDASFISPKGMTSGRQVILDRYRQSYPTRAALGTLSFEVLEVRTAHCQESKPCGALSLVARWRLAGADGSTRTGLTLLVLHPTPQGFEIVQDASM